MPEILASKIGFVTNGTSKLPGWVVNVENRNEFKGNLDHYLRDNMVFK